MVKLLLSSFIYYFLALTSAVGSTLMLDEMGYSTDWYHVILLFCVFNMLHYTLLWINGLSLKFTAHLARSLHD